MRGGPLIYDRPGAGVCRSRGLVSGRNWEFVSVHYDHPSPLRQLAHSTQSTITKYFCAIPFVPFLLSPLSHGAVGEC